MMTERDILKAMSDLKRTLSYESYGNEFASIAQKIMENAIREFNRALFETR